MHAPIRSNMTAAWALPNEMQGVFRDREAMRPTPKSSWQFASLATPVDYVQSGRLPCCTPAHRVAGNGLWRTQHTLPGTDRHPACGAINRQFPATATVSSLVIRSCRQLLTSAMLFLGVGLFAAGAFAAGLPTDLGTDVTAESSTSMLQQWIGTEPLAACRPDGSDTPMASDASAGASLAGTSTPSTSLASTGTPGTGLDANTAVARPEDLWQHLREGFALTPESSRRVDNQLSWYTHRPDYINRMIDRSKRYLHYIASEVKKRGMPSEIALLPMVESAYNPMAYSASHASGIWQFVPQTGKNFGLRETSWYDGRRDIVAATNAALTYLTRLHQQFGTWELALAAYNCGEGCVQHAIARNESLGLPTDYQDLNLPDETRDYVPKLLAIRQIVSDPQANGISLESIPDKAYFTTVTLDKPMDVALAARLANMPVHDFLSLNPGYSRPVIRSDSGMQVLLPVDRADTFTTNLNHYTRPLVSWQGCPANRGESLPLVARRCHTSVAELKAHNPLKLNRKGHFREYQSLIVPIRGRDNDGAFIQVSMQQTENAATDAGPAQHHAAAHGKAKKRNVHAVRKATAHRSAHTPAKKKPPVRKAHHRASRVRHPVH